MLKYPLIIFCFIFTFSANSQTTIIQTQNFDETSPIWNFTSDVPFFDHGSDGFFGVHDGDNDNDTNDTGIATKASSLGFINIQNDFLFINDLNDEGDNGTNNEAIISFEVPESLTRWKFMGLANTSGVPGGTVSRPKTVPGIFDSV